MRTDLGTFVFEIPPTADRAKVTVEYSDSSEPVVFHLLHHAPGRMAAVQLTGHLLEIEASETLIGTVWQVDGANQAAKRWARDRRCIECREHRKQFFSVCTGCLMKASEADLARRDHESGE